MSDEPTDASERPQDLALTELPNDRRSTILAATGLLASLLTAALTIIPSPYAIGTPGPTFDTLGDVNGAPLVSIEGAKVYETSGELRLTTVSQAPGSSTVFSVGQVIAAFFSKGATVTPEESVFGKPGEREQNIDQSAQEWVTSKEKATVSALEELGIPVPTTMTVVGIYEVSNAVGLLQEGDVIFKVDGALVETYAQFHDAIRAHKPGDDVTITVLRAGEAVDATFALLGEEGEIPRIGILVDPEFDIPITVDVKIDSVGGPSAGSMFALAIMDMLTELDELNGAKVAGTGTIDVDGEIGPIGGVRLKLLGAQADGAEHFLVPVENCGEVVGHVPAGLNVYAVDDLGDAYEALLAIGRNDTAKLPTCQAT